MDAVSTAEKAIVPVSADSEDSFDLLVVFQLATQEYGLMASSVREIIRNKATTRVPNAPVCIDGVINLRGQIIPVFNMHRRLGLAQPPAEETNMLTVMIVESADDNAGLLVERVSDVIRISPDMIDKNVSDIQSSVGQRFIDGIVKLENRLVTLLNIMPLLTD